MSVPHASDVAVILVETDLASVPVIVALFDVWQHVAIDLEANLVGILMLCEDHCPEADQIDVVPRVLLYQLQLRTFLQCLQQVKLTVLVLAVSGCLVVLEAESKPNGPGAWWMSCWSCC